MTLIAALATWKMSLKLAGVKLTGSGVQGAMNYFPSHQAPRALQEAA